MAPFKLDSSPHLSPETKAIAEKELRETPEVVQAALKELRELLKNDDTINFGDEEAILTIFLRPCKYYAKSAYELMKRVADFKEKQKALLENLLPEDERDAFTNHNVINVLKDKDHKGRRVLMVNCGGSWDTSKVTSDQLFRLFYLVHEGALVEPECQVRGTVVIMDYKDMSMKQVMALNPVFSLRLLTFIQDAMPLRLKEVHMVNQPLIFKMVWTIFKPMLKEKLKNRLFFHGTKMSSLHKYLEPSHLPSNYGGQLPEIDYTGADWYPSILEYMDFMKKLNSYGKVKK